MSKYLITDSSLQFFPYAVYIDALGEWHQATFFYESITKLDSATLNCLIKEIVVHERIDEDKTRHISIEIHFNLKPIPEVEQVTA